MAERKWCRDEFCVNDKCPLVADYCPVPDTPNVCKWEERTPRERGGVKVQEEPVYEQQRKDLAKADSGKPKLSLVPGEIIRAIARVREFGIKKYKDPDNWKQVEAERYRDAMYRHLLLYIEDPSGIDEESGLPHLKLNDLIIVNDTELYEGKFID